MNTLKYHLVNLECLLLIFSIVLGIGAAESSMWFEAALFLFGPFLYGKLVNFNKHIEFCEIYNRAWNIKYINNKSK